MGPPAEALARVELGQQRPGAGRQGALTGLPRGHLGVAPPRAEATLLTLASGADTLPDIGRGLTRGAADLLRAGLVDRGEHFDAVRQGAAETPLVALHRSRRAAAIGVGVAAPTRARVGGGDQYESAGQTGLAAGKAEDRDLA